VWTPKRLLEIRFEMIVMSRKKVMAHNVCAIGFGQRRCLEHWQQKCEKMKIFKKVPKEYQQVRTHRRLLEIRFEMIVWSRKKVMTDNVCAISFGQRRCLEHWQQKCEKMKIFKKVPKEYQ